MFLIASLFPTPPFACVEHHYMVFHLVNGVRASLVEMICEMDFVCYPQFLLNYESEPCYIENYNSYPYDSSSFPQQYPCCEDCGDLSEADHCQPPQYTINHPIFNAHNDLLNANNDLLNSQNKITIAQNKLMEQLTSMCAMVGHLIQKKQEEKQIEEEQVTNARYWKIPAYCDDDDDSAITPDEPVDSLSMGDEHLNTILETESDEFIKSCVENLVPNTSDSEDESDDDQSCSDEDVPEKFFLNLLFEEKIIPIKIDQHHDNAESTHDSSFIISSKIDSLLDEFFGELTLLKSILPGIDETYCHPENEIRLPKRLLYDNSPPHSDSFMEEIYLSFDLDDPMPSGIEDDDYDSERDILIHEKLLDNYSLSLPVIKSYHFDIPSFSRPPTKPPDGNTGILNIKMMGDNSEQKQEEKQIEEEQAANARYWKISACCDDDDDSAITPNEPVDSLMTINHVLMKMFQRNFFRTIFIPIKIDQHHDNAESTHDSSLIISSKNDSLLDEFAGELTLLKSIPPGIDATDRDPEEDIRLIERLLYDNSSPRPPKEFVSKNSNADIESFSPSPIPVEDSDSLMEEIDLFLTSDDPIPSSIEEDDDDSERDILIHEELLDNYSLSLHEKSPDLLSHRSLEIFQPSAKCPMMIHGKNIPILDVPLFYFYPLDQFKYGGNWVKLSDLKQALRGRHPMLILVQYSRKCEDSRQRILSSKSSFPQLQLGINYPNLID
nr:hypothetical protein [Tanacetum cinerariifolium]